MIYEDWKIFRRKKNFFVGNFSNLIKFENLKNLIFFKKNFFVLLVMFNKQSEFRDLSYIHYHSKMETGKRVHLGILKKRISIEF
jgi:hypothetical protein